MIAQTTQTKSLDPDKDLEYRASILRDAKRHLGDYQNPDLPLKDRLAGLHGATGALFRSIPHNSSPEYAEALRIEYLEIIMNPDDPNVQEEREVFTDIFEN